VQNVVAADLLINGQAATNVSGSGPGPYVFSFPQPANGTVTFQWAAGQGITDLASPPNAFAGGSWSVTENSAAGVSSIRINEILADNADNPNVNNPFVDENGSFSPWIELFNSGTSSVNLAGWSLTDDSTQPEMWVFPSGSQSVIAAGGYLVIWADSKNITNPASGNKMHTNFTLSQNGSYLGLFTADLPRTTAESQFSPSYPIQEADVSYGYVTSTGLNNYFTTPTPGAANGTSTGALDVDRRPYDLLYNRLQHPDGDERNALHGPDLDQQDDGCPSCGDRSEPPFFGHRHGDLFLRREHPGPARESPWIPNPICRCSRQ
jgi:hypothetical protein